MTAPMDTRADSTALEREIEQLLFNKITSGRMVGFTVTVAHEIMGLVRNIGIPAPAQAPPDESRLVTQEDREYASELLADLTSGDLPRLEIAARWFRKARVERSLVPSTDSGAVNQSPGMNEREGVEPTSEQLFCDWLRGYFRGLAGKDELTASEANTIRNTLNSLAPVPSAWQPMETAPRDETPILATDARLKDVSAVVFWYHTNTKFPWQTDDGIGYAEGRFTHWMLVPPLPSSDRGGVG